MFFFVLNGVPAKLNAHIWTASQVYGVFVFYTRFRMTLSSKPSPSPPSTFPYDRYWQRPMFSSLKYRLVIQHKEKAKCCCTEMYVLCDGVGVELVGVEDL